MSNDVLVTMLVVAALLAPLALHIETQSSFGWSPGFLRSLLITGLIFGATVLPLVLADQLDWLSVEVEDWPFWISGLLTLGWFTFTVCVVFCAVALLLRSPSGYPLRSEQAVRFTRTLLIHLFLLVIGLVLGSAVVFQQLADTTVPALLERYGSPLILVFLYLLAIGSSFGVIEPFEERELGEVRYGWGTVLAVLGAPLVLVGGLLLLKPLLPSSGAAVRPLHVLSVLLTLVGLVSMVVWPLLSIEARRPLPLLRIIILGAYLTVGMLLVLTTLEFGMAIFQGVAHSSPPTGAAYEP